MNPIKPFQEFLNEGIVKKQSPNKNRSKSLLKETEGAYNFLKEVIQQMGITDKNANYVVKNAYDIIMELIRAKMLTERLNSSGRGAHEAEVSYLRELKFPEVEVQFINQLRYFRNGIVYYGKILDKEYATNVMKFLDTIYLKLKHLIKEK